MTPRPFDLVFVGGGLANMLAAWRLASKRPDVRFCVLEAGKQAGGTPRGRTWSFHDSDLEPGCEWPLELAMHSWSGYQVRFPDFSREVEGSYRSIRSEDLHDVLVSRLGSRLRFDAPVEALEAGGVRLQSQEWIGAAMVVDGRGLRGGPPFPCAYQKFFGLDLELREPHGLTRPVLMDATVAQTDGFRFVYVLPWSPRRLLVEDTYYSDTPELDHDLVAGRVRQYAIEQGWDIAREMGEEHGALPIPLAGEYLPAARDGIALSGVASGRFHPTTGYSLASAVRFADRLARTPHLSPDVADELNQEAKEEWLRGDFFRRLNNMLFRAAEPTRRWTVMAQFYRRDQDLIRRFYHGDLRRLDQLKLLSGKPPVPVARGLAAFVERIRSPLA